MYRVLLPVDRNVDRARRQATYVAGLPLAEQAVEATVLYVVPPADGRSVDEMSFSDVASAVEAAEHLDSSGIDVTRDIQAGSSSERIIEAADDLDAHEVVMGGRKRSGVTQVLLGSTVQDVFLSADRPVTIVGTDAGTGAGRRQVLVPVDRDRERARHQVEYVAALPDAGETVDATVLYVFPHLDYAGAPPHDFEEIDAAVEAAAFLEDRGVPVDRIGVGGEVVRTILDTAEDLDAHGIVVGGRKRSGVQKVLLGSTAQDVILSARRPVTLAG